MGGGPLILDPIVVAPSGYCGSITVFPMSPPSLLMLLTVYLYQNSNGGQPEVKKERAITSRHRPSIEAFLQLD